jgi:hypothetical protein
MHGGSPAAISVGSFGSQQEGQSSVADEYIGTHNIITNIKATRLQFVFIFLLSFLII